jgi:hypothetical protein
MIQHLSRHQDSLIDRQGLALAARLNEASAALPRDVSERLRAGRERALAYRKVQAQALRASQGVLALADGTEETMGWVGRLGTLLALCLLVVGMLGISEIQNELRARELAQVDLALLLDDLPPAAFSDPGFIQFLKSEER